MWFDVFIEGQFGAEVSSNILWCLLVGMVWLLIVSDRVLLYSAGSGVKSAEEDFEGLS